MESFGFNIKLPLIEKASTNVKDIISHIKLNDGVYFEKTKLDHDEIVRNLENNNVYKKIEAMKHILIAHILKKNVSSFFFNVLTNISVDNLILKKLIYNYLILYAHGNTDLTLLSANSFKKDLSNNNYQIRSWALRAMASIKSIDIINILIGSLKRLSNDNSPYVRKTCADVIPSIYLVDKDQFIFLRKLLIKLISDRELTVVSSAIISFSTVCIYNQVERPHHYEELHNAEYEANTVTLPKDQPFQDSTEFTNVDNNRDGKNVPNHINQITNKHNATSSSNEQIEFKNGNIQNSDSHFMDMCDATHIFSSLSFLHTHYYKLCKYLLYMHPYNQTYLIDLLLRYCRMFYKNPLRNEKINLKKQENIYDNNISNGDLSNQNDYDTYDEYKNYTIDIEIFINKLIILLSSSSYCVVLGSISALYNLTELTYKEEIIQAILFCLLKSNAEKNDEAYEIFLKSVKPIIKLLKNDFSLYISYFFINSHDSTIKKSLKIDILYMLNKKDNKMIILNELIHTLYIPNNSELIIKKLFKYITEIALQSSECLSKVINQIMIMLNSNIKIYSYESILSLRKLLQQNDSKKIKKIIFFLTKILLQVQSNEVKISILWILANYQKYIDYLLLFDLSRILVKSFEVSDDAFKIHIIHFLFKIWIYQYGHIIRSGSCEDNKNTNSQFPNSSNNQFNEHKVEQDKMGYDNDDKIENNFLLFENLCKNCFFIASRDKNFDIQDTSKFYYHIMFVINKLKSQNMLDYQLLQSNIFNQPISDFTLSLSYLKFFYLHSGRSIITHSLNLGSKNLSENKSGPPFYQSEQDNHISHNNSEHKKINILQLNTISNLLNTKIVSYVNLPDFAQTDLPNTEHINNIEKEKKQPISFSSDDLKYNKKIVNNINPHIFVNIDDFYKEEKIKSEKNKFSNFSDTSFLINKGAKIQGEDDESDDNQQSPKINESEKSGHAKDVIYEEVDDIEKFFFNDNE
ncbi:AP-3 complex subunit beta, putative [Plasmodium chabaudi chabaudi]|uniref:AP-3 complex subunit beta, putative n=1 Tax=Plasmodium chabaudi chabaudi TaxID=31271 RepID=A0A4V0K017_PLACU|nr:AP-3 complex subunit beta, putative [Plasmodium chabaudi chabaudi]VTZ66305.1 AP-3 complex subunit beta, putative [Plasmodium chabaudi chabaudi]|eukprot:XP_737370.2 AP-3 complex subunit beta, putative [Plasmodium chabaudi chabaudi]